MSQQKAAGDGDKRAGQVPVKAELEHGQEVRILVGRYRGTVGHVTGAQWDAEAEGWRYIVTGERVDLGEYTAKELW